MILFIYFLFYFIIFFSFLFVAFLGRFYFNKNNEVASKSKLCRLGRQDFYFKGQRGGIGSEVC